MYDKIRNMKYKIFQNISNNILVIIGNFAMALFYLDHLMNERIFFIVGVIGLGILPIFSVLLLIFNIFFRIKENIYGDNLLIILIYNLIPILVTLSLIFGWGEPYFLLKYSVSYPNYNHESIE